MVANGCAANGLERHSGGGVLVLISGGGDDMAVRDMLTAAAAVGPVGADSTLARAVVVVDELNAVLAVTLSRLAKG